MQRRLLALLLCVSVCWPFAAQAGDDSDPFVDFGLDEAVKGTKYEDWYHQYNIYYQEGTRGAAILSNEVERDLFLFTHAGGGWQTDAILKDAVCQGQGHCTFVFGEDSDPSGGNLMLSHHCSVYTTEMFSFRHDGAEWVFEYAYFRTPTGDRETDDIYTNPMEVAYVTWQDGKLVFDWYIDDMYGKLPDAERVKILKEWAWIKGDRPSYTVDWPERITLKSFQFDAFPRDELTLASKELPEYNCGWKLGENPPGLVYAVVNNPNPKDRLNLRKGPDTKSEYLGKYYNGMEVRVLEERTDGWVYVFVGNNRNGYMRREYLAFGEAGESVVSAMPAYTAPARAWSLLYAPFDDSNVKAEMTGGERIEVMGVVSGWWHVRCEGKTGFMRELEKLD